MLRNFRIQSTRWVKDGPRRTLPSLALSETKRGMGRFVTGPRLALSAVAEKVKSKVQSTRHITDKIIFFIVPPAVIKACLFLPYLALTLCATDGYAWEEGTTKDFEQRT
jgi:hypothetical protein